MHHKRKKTKRRVRCSICTTHKWKGNIKDRRPHRDHREELDLKDEDAE